MESDQEVKSQLKTSLMYPFLVLVVAIVAIIGLFTFVVPQIVVLLEDLNESLPWPTVVIMSVSEFMRKFWWLLAFLGIGVFGYARQLKASVAGRFMMDEAIQKIPLVGNFIMTSQIGRFSRGLGTLLENGVAMVAALEAALQILDNEVMRSQLQEAVLDIKHGTALSVALRARNAFPEEAVGVISVGEETGRLPQSLYKLADLYERRSQRSMKRLSVLIEPLLIIFLGLVVGFIFIGMLLPILKMNMVIK